MSRDALGAPDAHGASPGPDLPEPTSTGRVDDLDTVGSPVDDGGAGGWTRRAPTRPTSGRGRLRGVVALLVAALVGASAALLAERGADDGPPPLTLLLAWGGGSPTDAEDDVVVELVVANSGPEDLVLTAAGTGGPSRRLEGELEPSGLGLAGRRTGTDATPGSEVVVPARSTAALGLRLEVSCTDPPPWRPWVEVRSPSTATEVVDLPAVDDVLGSGDDALLDACTAYSPLLLTPSVVGQRTDPDGLVLQVRNDTDVPYRVEVVDGGVAGLSLADAGVRLAPAATTDVAVRVAPDDCAAALDAPDLLADVSVSAVRLEDGQGPARATLVLDPFAAGAQVGVGVGRACAGTAAEEGPGGTSDDGSEVRRVP
ncbi:hypothetical protein WDZ17_08915 [Pseudokineococcus basanitobsidens]|uniref:Uncharacterized protein n=1 Tax=Pseudokineococcus basanitobsidens TaxID=1926649 RepID=A0ABU8RK13_9ACTN